MKILSNTGNTANYIKNSTPIKREAASFDSAIRKTNTKTTKNFDEVTIRAKGFFDEKKFSEDLSRKILNDVMAPTDTQKVDEIKAQYQNGDYHIMIDEIAKKMLLS